MEWYASSSSLSPQVLIKKMKSFRHLTTVIALTLLAFHQAVASPTLENQLEAQSDSQSQASPADIQAYLTAHNSVRAQHGAAPLTWSDQVASKAQQWANGCVFQHSGGTLGPYGENLAAGTDPAYDIAAAINSWTDEVSQYDPNNPVASHFTQVVWKATTQLGCALQTCPPGSIFPSQFGSAKYYVCEYSPPGNVDGQYRNNVQV